MYFKRNRLIQRRNGLLAHRALARLYQLNVALAAHHGVRARAKREVLRIFIAQDALVLLHIGFLCNESRWQLQWNRRGDGIRRHWLKLGCLWWRHNDARVHRQPRVKPAEPGARALVVTNAHARPMRVISLVIHAPILVPRHGENNVGRQTVQINGDNGAVGRPPLEKQVRRILGRVKLALGALRVVNEIAKRPHLVVARGVPIHRVRILQKHPHVGAVHNWMHVPRVRALDAGRHVVVVFLTIHEELVVVVGWHFLAVHGPVLVMQIRGGPFGRGRHPLGGSFAGCSKCAYVVIHVRVHYHDMS